MSKKYRIVKLPEDETEVCFYGAEIGDIIKLEDIQSSGVWCIGSDVFKEKGWERLATYCVATERNSFLKHVEEV